MFTAMVTIESRLPALDSLARDGIRFAQVFTPSPITNTAHTSILTGLLPSVHGVTDFAIPLAKTYPTWAELLKRDGYQTAAFIGAVVLDSRTLAPGLDRGFDYYDNFPSDSAEGRHWGRVERRGDDVVHRAEAWMGAHPQNPRSVWVTCTILMTHTNRPRLTRRFTKTICTTVRSHTRTPRWESC